MVMKFYGSCVMMHGQQNCLFLCLRQKGSEKNVSLLDLNKKAHERVEEIRRANAVKSLAKIKELTAEH